MGDNEQVEAFAVRQNVPSITIAKARPGDPEGPAITITIVNQDSPSIIAEAEDAWRRHEAAQPGVPMKPVFTAEPNEDGGFDCYVSLINDSDTVRIGRPPSQTIGRQ